MIKVLLVDLIFILLKWLHVPVLFLSRLENYINFLGFNANLNRRVFSIDLILPHLPLLLSGIGYGLLFVGSRPRLLGFDCVFLAFLLFKRGF
jgi:hypothetical protein